MLPEPSGFIVATRLSAAAPHTEPGRPDDAPKAMRPFSPGNPAPARAIGVTEAATITPTAASNLSRPRTEPQCRAPAV